MALYASTKQNLIASFNAQSFAQLRCFIEIDSCTPRSEIDLLYLSKALRCV